MAGSAADRARWLARMKEEKQHAKQIVREEFEEWDHNNLAQQMLHQKGGAEQRVYGGIENTAPRELQLVDAWRPAADGTWQLGKGIIHRVHHEDNTVTVQFLPDQHRCRLPFASIQPNLDIEPVYPKIRLRPGERIPTCSEIEVREHNAEIRRQQLGIPPHQPLPEDDEDPLLDGEHMNQAGVRVVYSDTWGMPSTTLAALRDRSIPFAQVKGYYEDHFYSHLYNNNFYAQESGEAAIGSGGQVSTGAVGTPVGRGEGLRQSRHGHRPKGPVTKVVSHLYIPLHGPPRQQNLTTGQWEVAREEQTNLVEGPGWFG